MITLTKIGFSAPLNPDCASITNLKSKYLCHRFVHINFGGTNGYYVVDLEQVQSIYREDNATNKYVMKNGESMTFPNSLSSQKFYYYLNFLDQNPEFIK